ncbi:MAG: hypothetical protein L3J96_03795, partial [Thermoplasmata archaeon]|nr:hypothetical protein [Thermoplasmata archaeon]
STGSEAGNSDTAPSAQGRVSSGTAGVRRLTLRETWEEAKRAGPAQPGLRRQYATVFVVMVLAPVLITAWLTSRDFRPNLSEDFLFLYFSITSALAVGIWSTLILADQHGDKRVSFFPSILAIMAAILALVGAVAGPGAAAIPLDLSLGFLLVALVWMMFHATLHVLGAELRRSVEIARSGIPLGSPSPPSSPAESLKK